MNKAEENSPPNREKALLEWIQQVAPYGVVTLDESYQVHSWNRWMETHSGLCAVDVVGKDIFALFPDLEPRKLIPHFKRALAGEACVLSTSLHRHLFPFPAAAGASSGALMRQTARVAPLIAGFTICGIVIVIEDVTQREDQSEALIRQHHRQEILAWTSAHLLKSDQPWKTIRQLFFKVAEHMDFDTFFLYLRDMDTDVLRLYTVGGIPPGIEPEFANYALLRDVAETPAIVVFDSIQTRVEPQYALLKKAQVSAAVAIPLFANNRSLGILCFGTATRASIAQPEIELLAAVAQYLAISVDRERTHHQLQKAKEALSEHAQLLEGRVQERTARLEDTISELEIFSYTLAHDLKAPVRAMLAYCDILMEEFGGILPAPAKDIIRRLAGPPKRMESLILDLLEFSKVSRQELVLSRVEIEPVIEDVMALRAFTIRQAVTLRPPFPAVRAHKELLRQVLLNLIDNAIKFVLPGEQPSITISAERVTSGTPSTRSNTLLFSSRETAPNDTTTIIGPNTSRVRIWVIDRGIGIRPELHQKIFGIFERGVDSDLYEGTGMGLAIVARAVQRMGGTCGLESTPGQGSKFWIELPAA